MIPEPFLQSPLLNPSSPYFSYYLSLILKFLGGHFQLIVLYYLYLLFFIHLSKKHFPFFIYFLPIKIKYFLPVLLWWPLLPLSHFEYEHTHIKQNVDCYCIHGALAVCLNHGVDIIWAVFDNFCHDGVCYHESTCAENKVGLCKMIINSTGNVLSHNKVSLSTFF